MDYIADNLRGDHWHYGCKADKGTPDRDVFLKRASRWHCVAAAFSAECIAVIDFVLVRLRGRETNSLNSTLKKKRKADVYNCDASSSKCYSGTDSGSMPSRLSCPVCRMSAHLFRKGPQRSIFFTVLIKTLKQYQEHFVANLCTFFFFCCRGLQIIMKKKCYSFANCPYTFVSY